MPDLSNPKPPTAPTTPAAAATNFGDALSAEVDAGLGLVLGRDGPAGEAAVAAFRRMAGDKGHDLTRLVVVRDGGRPVWGALPVVDPGRAALVLTARDVPEGQAAAARDALRAATRRLAGDGVVVSQVLAEPDSLVADVAESAGYGPLAELAYFVRDVPRRPTRAEAARPGVTWQAYEPGLHEAFVETLAATYPGSRDCPALTGVREPADILRGHQAAGDFEPTLWERLLVDGEPAGLVLLAGLPGSRAAELVYLGLLPDRRGGGLGDAAVGRALHLCRSHDRTPLTLAADASNSPALNLYRRHGFAETHRRLALMQVL